MVNQITKSLKTTLSAIISSQLIIALSAVCLSYETMIVYGMELELLPVFGFIFFSTLGIYNLAYLGTNPFHRSVFANRKFKLLTCASAMLGSACLGFFLTIESITIAVITGVLIFVYLYKLKWQHKVLQTRNIPLVKNVLLAFIWAIVTVLLPLSVYRQASFNFGDDMFIFLRRFFFILAIAIPYDIRDYSDDMKNNLQTLPVRVGIGKSKMIALVSLSCFALLVLYNTSFRGVSEEALLRLNTAFLMSTAITALIIMLTNVSRKNYYFSVLMDGTMIVQFILVVLCLKI